METILKPIHQNWFQENERHERARLLIQINDDGNATTTTTATIIIAAAATTTTATTTINDDNSIECAHTHTHNVIHMVCSTYTEYWKTSQQM